MSTILQIKNHFLQAIIAAIFAQNLLSATENREVFFKFAEFYSGSEFSIPIDKISEDKNKFILQSEAEKNNTSSCRMEYFSTYLSSFTSDGYTSLFQDVFNPFSDEKIMLIFAVAKPLFRKWPFRNKPFRVTLYRMRFFDRMDGRCRS